jgi:hypothetical protein
VFFRPFGRRRTRSAAIPGVAGRRAGPHERLGSHERIPVRFATICRRTAEAASPPHTPGQDRRGTSRQAESGAGGSRAKPRECGPLTEATFRLPQTAGASAPSAPAFAADLGVERGGQRGLAR